VKGDGKGLEIGFATANLDTDDLVLPPNGVYAVHTRLRQATNRAVLNIGLRPTLAKPKPTLQVEAHLLDFESDLYGETLGVEFVERLRDEKPFSSLDELTEQISRDIELARTLF
jgi:riboflavin kinase/FMN adenylyltransferase